ncbi:hypothetical protein SAMN05421644_10887 [Allochromatium warmingii]|uniref:DUF2202 domain-containing protein n=2 Tax=Allochromatium warmingii TaxID=61595 RepID=A0A1H3DE55_ALLWA|nr:hypothetical protein SAMN05421644_10887 [Allochromatium warmingii]
MKKMGQNTHSHATGRAQYVNHHRQLNDDYDALSLTLTEDAASGLIYLIEEEKMARDLYDAFAEQTGSLIFERISDSEQQHLDALLMVADAAGIDVPELLEQPGTFHNPTIQNLYNTLLEQGSVSFAEAIAVGIAVEETDIYDLQQLLPETEISLLGVVYSNLLAGSQNHLAAFESF